LTRSANACEAVASATATTQIRLIVIKVFMVVVDNSIKRMFIQLDSAAA
jgi:hypothetical protein